jgi:hypothetical protein
MEFIELPESAEAGSEPIELAEVDQRVVIEPGPVGG